MRVVIGEDEALLREGLVLMLGHAGFDVVGESGDADQLRRIARTEEPDLLVTDIRMPPGHSDDGLRAALDLRRDSPDMAVMVLSQHVERRYALELLGERPARVGYLLKQRISDAATFCRDLQRVCDGGTVLDPEVVERMLARARPDSDPLASLSPRQLEVLAHIAEGRNNASIARSLTISEKAVVQHTSHIYDLLNLPPDTDGHRRVLAVIRYLSR